MMYITDGWVYPPLSYPLMVMSLRIYRVAVNIRFRRRSECFYQIFHIKCGNADSPESKPSPVKKRCLQRVVESSSVCV